MIVDHGDDYDLGGYDRGGDLFVDITGCFSHLSDYKGNPIKKVHTGFHLNMHPV